MNQSDLVAATEHRSRFYWWLAGWVLNAPTPTDLEAVKRMDTTTDLATPELTHAMHGLITAARGLADTDLKGHLGTEYTRLVGGLQRAGAPPPPYEAVWREDRLMGEATVAVIEFYLQTGFSDIDPSAGPQDHLGVELKFMSLLALKEYEAWKADDEAASTVRLTQQRMFLDRHLQAWTPQWAARIIEDSREPFYTRLAEVIRAFLELDRQHLESLVPETA